MPFLTEAEAAADVAPAAAAVEVEDLEEQESGNLRS